MLVRVLRTLGGILIAVLVAELVVRLSSPTPRVQVVSAERVHTLEQRGDTVVWSVPPAERRGCAGAAEDVTRVTFVGSSIFYGSGVPWDKTFAPALDGMRDDLCVDNPSNPAFTAEQKRVVALEALAAPHPPDVLMWEVWLNDLGAYRQIGSAAYNLVLHPVDASGRPNPWSLPEALSRTLFDGSELYRYGVFALGGLDPEREDPQLLTWPAMLERDLLPVVVAAREVGTEVRLVVCPALDKAFSTSARRPPTVYKYVWPFAEAHGLSWIRLSDALEHDDVEALRVDTCCHYSEAGHARLAEVFSDALAPPDP